MATPRGSFSIEVESITQKGLHSDRKYENKLSQGSAKIQMKIEDCDGSLDSRDVFCRVEIMNENSDTLFTVESVVRAVMEVDVDGDVDVDDIGDTVSELALRVSYPYHRLSIGNAVLQAGLPGFILPLAADTEWVRIVKESKILSDEDSMASEKESAAGEELSSSGSQGVAD